MKIRWLSLAVGVALVSLALYASISSGVFTGDYCNSSAAKGVYARDVCERYRGMGIIFPLGTALVGVSFLLYVIARFMYDRRADSSSDVPSM